MADADRPVVVCADEQHDVDLDPARWAALAEALLERHGMVGELTLTFVDRSEIAGLNLEHMGIDAPTDVLAFPLDVADAVAAPPGQPLLLGDVVVCPAVAASSAATHAGTLDDELALLVVHGILHVLGHDHADAGEAARMRTEELAALEALHWHGPAPAGFSFDHLDG